RKGRDYALLFAGNHYENWGNLKNPSGDMRAVKKVLESQYAFQVESVEDADRALLLNKIKEYHERQFDPDDQFLIFFAGHGFYDNRFKEGYLVTKESKDPQSDGGRSSYLSHIQLRKHIDTIPCNHILVIMDVCF